MNKEHSYERIEVVAAVMVSDGKVFASERGYGAFKGKWEFPGGKREAGETPEEALAREIREELATEIHVGEKLCTVEYDYPEFHLVLHCYLCSILSGNLELLEHEDARWLDARHLRDVDWLPADLEVIELLEKRL